MLYTVRKALNDTISTIGSLYRNAKGPNYRTLNEHVLNISKFKDIDSILSEVSKSLNELLEYKLFAFIVKDTEATEVWIDHQYYNNSSIIDIILKDVGSQKSDCKIHYFNYNKGMLTIALQINELAPYTLIGKEYLSRMYVLPSGKTFSYHNEVINIILKTIGITLEHSIDIKKLESTAAIDPLTGCYNRRALNSYIEHDIANTKRYGGDLSIIMFDLDHFKKINDNFGHSVGDIVLQEVCKVVTSVVRKCDYLTRYGGEEFVLVLPKTKLVNAVDLAEKLRRKIESHKINAGEKTIDISASFGVAALRDNKDKQVLFDDADTMLYKAKASGRNAVMPGMFQRTNAISFKENLGYKPI